jgi:hypothetical protein
LEAGKATWKNRKKRQLGTGEQGEKISLLIKKGELENEVCS